MASDAKLNERDARKARQAEAAKARLDAEERSKKAAIDLLPEVLVAAFSGDLGFDVLRVGATRKDTWWRVSVTVAIGGDEYVGFADVTHPALLWDGVARVVARDEWQRSMFPTQRDRTPATTGKRG